MFVKRFLFAVVLPLLLVGMLLAACGNNANTTTATSPAATPAPTTAPAPPVVMTASATVGGKAVTILTNTQGMTLYYFTPDSSSTSACTASCATNWPPLLFAGTGTPNGPATLPGKLSATTCTNGNQVQYQNHFLYTFAGDTKPGDTKGQGLASGKWQVATTDLPPLSNPGGGGYNNNYGY